eukprot:CAMPEP_0173381450 /NCGR_PEP_ID=MMETSP1356-20130122/3821_1 /TAXON_ID=77927 ORGANISM="Hemiselmis virescens, Strain PCC157" /NCGR_SAMPLE_ID=MMETSP1356 /ASSEMBLY_ACC=CAM_ASM_000847 /LENGTH=43 /DNA_ID= /DNA_START= /DNA_END= /DNA_ORIENTATION=
MAVISRSRAEWSGACSLTSRRSRKVVSGEAHVITAVWFGSSSS